MLVGPVYFPNTAAVGTGLVNGRLPWRALARFDQWNWKPLSDISRASGFEEPRIALLGAGRNLDPSHIRNVWAFDGKLNTDAKMLWWPEFGEIDWDRVMESIGESDIVLTAPGYSEGDATKTVPGNEHNSEFVQRLSGDPRFRGPIRVWMGRFEPIAVDVFVRLR